MTHPVRHRFTRLRTALAGVVWFSTSLLVATPWLWAATAVADVTISTTPIVAADPGPPPARPLNDEQRHVIALEASLGQLRSDAQASQKVTADLQARLDEALTRQPESAAIYPLAWVAGLLTLTTLLLGGLLWHESRQRNVPWWLAPQTVADGPPRHVGAAPPAWPPEVPIRRAAEAEGWGSTVTPCSAVAATLPAGGTAGGAAVESTYLATRADTQPMPLPQFDLNPAAGANATPDEVQRAPAGAPISELSVQALTDLAQQADFFVALGQDDAAVDLLMGLVRSDAQTGAMPYLKLLKIYRRRGENDAYERIRERFNRRFNVSAPPWEVESAADSQPDQLAKLTHAGESSDALPFTAVHAEPACVRSNEIDLLLPFGVQRTLMSSSDFAPWIISADLDLDLSDPPSFVSGASALRPTIAAKTRDHSSSAFER